MRIISGKHKGRRIDLLKEASGAVRPTSDFAREAVFNILSHGKIAANHSFVGKNVLDIFCGTGAFGLEALSRGAGSVTFIDSSREVLNNARYNTQRMGEMEKVDFIQANAPKIGSARRKYSLVFLDPPYFEKLIPPTLVSLHEGGWIATDALIIIEHDSKEDIKVPDCFAVLDQRKYGRAVIEVLQAVV